MEPVKTRGYLLQTTLKYAQEGLHADRRATALAKIPPETLRFIDGLKPTEWYTLEHYNVLLDAVADASGGDENLAKDDLIRCGVFAANEATNTFLRLLMKVLTPTLFAKKLPSLFERDFNRGKVEVKVEDDRLVCSLSNVKGFRHVALTSAGFATFTLETMGKSLLERNIRGWTLAEPDPNEVEFELIWRT